VILAATRPTGIGYTDATTEKSSIAVGNEPTESSSDRLSERIDVSFLYASVRVRWDLAERVVSHSLGTVRNSLTRLEALGHAPYSVLGPVRRAR
jgi:hypothetical protein